MTQKADPMLIDRLKVSSIADPMLIDRLKVSSSSKRLQCSPSAFQFLSGVSQCTHLRYRPIATENLPNQNLTSGYIFVTH